MPAPPGVGSRSIAHHGTSRLSTLRVGMVLRPWHEPGKISSGRRRWRKNECSGRPATTPANRRKKPAAKSTGLHLNHLRSPPKAARFRTCWSEKRSVYRRGNSWGHNHFEKKQSVLPPVVLFQPSRDHGAIYSRRFGTWRTPAARVCRERSPERFRPLRRKPRVGAWTHPP